VKDVAQDLAEGVAKDVPPGVAQDLAFGARAARALLSTPPPPQPPSLCISRSDGSAAGQLSGIWLGLGLWVSAYFLLLPASRGAAQSASMLIAS